MHFVNFFVCFPIFCFLLNFKNILSQDFYVKDFNATGDGKTDDTNAVRAAFNAAAKNGGGRMVFDKGYVFLTGCFNMTSNIIWDIRGVILASNSSNDYVAVQPLPWFDD
jgi:polygalacturonase